MDKGSNLDLQDNYGRTVLMKSCFNNKIEIARILIAPKNCIRANLDLQDEDGYTALIWACYEDNIEIASYLLEYL